MPSPVSVVLVAFGWSSEVEARLRRFIHPWSDPTSVLVVQNDTQAPDSTFFRTIRGSNSHAEFSGYLEGYLALTDQHRGSAAVLVLNDTLFSHRWSFGWKRAVRLWAHRPPHALLGDLRSDPIPGTDRTLNYFSSWIFALHGPHAHSAFLRGLKYVLDSENWGAAADPDPAYRLWVQQYLDGRNGRGWSRSKTASEALRALKKQCIYAEHRLGLFWYGNLNPTNAASRYLPDKSICGTLGSEIDTPTISLNLASREDEISTESIFKSLILGNLSGPWRPSIRVADRLLSAKRRWSGQVRGRSTEMGFESGVLTESKSKKRG